PPGAAADIPGLEFAGEIVEPPAGAGAWKRGDRVMGLLAGGGYAQRAAVPASTLLPVPAALSWAEAGAIPEVFLTAADALFERGRLTRGERVLIHSAGGGVGTAALQLARVGGASLIFGTASAPKLRGLERIGLPLDVGIDYRSESFARAVAERTAGEGVNVIVDTVGADYWDNNVASLAVLGRLVLVGLLGGAETRVSLSALMRRRLTVVGTVLRARPVAEKAALTESFRRRFLPSFDDGALRPVLDGTFPLERAAEAHAAMEANRTLGKIVLEVP
ncbi:MAG: zinc-binding dehydrogenase, partial [Gemmatimonadota bacterium]